MKDDCAELLNVVGLLYESTLDEAKWLPALESFARFAGGHAAFHIIADPSTGAVSCSEQVGVDPAANELYQRYYAAKEVRIPPALAHGVGQVVTEGRLLDRRTYESSEIYADLLRPYDIPHIMAMWLQRSPQACQAVVIEAGHRHGPFEQDALDKYLAVAPHLIRAARIREALVLARQERYLNWEILNRLPIGVIFLDVTGVVTAASACAERLGKSFHTCKTQLKSIYAKTGCRNHVELTKALFMSALAQGSPEAHGSDLYRRDNR